MATAESRKRRARHEIWDLEAEVEKLNAKIAELQEANGQLRLSQTVLQQTVTVREAQVERLKQHGQAGPATRTLHTSSSFGSDGPTIKDSWLQQARSHSSTPCTSTASAGLFELLPSCTSSPARDALSPSGPSGSASTPSTSCCSPFTELLGLLDPTSPAAPHADMGLLDLVTSAGLHQAGHQGSLLQGAGLTGVCGALTATGSSLEQELHRATSMTETQLINTFKQASEQLSSLLFCAEDTSSPQAPMAAAQLAQVVHTVRSTGAVAKVCNPAILNIVAQPVSSGLEPAGPEHWEAVARALLLSPQQVQQVVALDQLRAKWLQRIHKDHAVVSEALQEVLAQEAGQGWLVDCHPVTVRKVELMDKLRRMAGAGRWVVVLVDELLLLHILSPIQVARYMVHSYPYVPDACAIVEAVHGLHRQQRAAALNPVAALRKPASRGRKRVNPVPPPRQ